MAQGLRMWVGCLACYNNGVLAGEWFDAEDAPTEMTGEGQESWNGRINEASVQVHPDHYNEGHEELWVFDHEGFPTGAGEFSPGIGRDFTALLADNHITTDDTLGPFYAYLDNQGIALEQADRSTIADYQDAYAGEWETQEEFAEETAMDCDMINSKSPMVSYIDWERFARDLFIGDYWSTSGGAGIYVFRSM